MFAVRPAYNIGLEEAMSLLTIFSVWSLVGYDFTLSFNITDFWKDAQMDTKIYVNMKLINKNN